MAGWQVKLVTVSAKSDIAKSNIALINTSGIVDKHALDLQKPFPTRIQPKSRNSKG